MAADDGSTWPVGPDGQPLTPAQIEASGINNTGYNSNPNARTWFGGQRSPYWQPPEFLQNYGNYTGLFPSMGQQVGQALHGSIQGRAQQPPWMQSMLPPRQNSFVNMRKYSPFQSGARVMNNPYPLNGRVNMTTPNIGQFDHGANPFIGLYQGLGGFNGNGPPPPPPGMGTQPPPPPPGGTQPPGGSTQPPPPVVNQPMPGTGTQPTGGTQPPPAGPIIEPAPGTGGPSGGPSMGGTPYTGQTPGTLGGTPYGGLPTGGGMFGTPYTPTQPGPSSYPPPQPMTPQQNTLGQSPTGGLPGLLGQMNPQMLTALMGMFRSR